MLVVGAVDDLTYGRKRIDQRDCGVPSRVLQNDTM